MTDCGIKDASKASCSSDSGVRVDVVVGMLAQNNEDTVGAGPWLEGWDLVSC